MDRAKNAVKKSYRNHQQIWKNRQFVLSVIIGIIFLITGFVINYFAGVFATNSVSSSVTDIILDNTRVWDVTFIFVNGAVIFWAFIAILLIVWPQKIPFTLKSVALFTVIRSIFITLTHLAPFPSRLMLPAENLIDMFTFGGDLFFSAHTGGPFLMALIFWDHKYIRYVCLASSIIFGWVVLLGHLHYSIDVFAAFFITYSIYHIARHFFKRDYALFSQYNDSQIK